VPRDPLPGDALSHAERTRYDGSAMPLDGLPLTDRIRFQFDKAPTTGRVRQPDNRLRGSPQASLALHADRERLKRPEQRQIAGRAACHDAKGIPGPAHREWGQRHSACWYSEVSPSSLLPLHALDSRLFYEGVEGLRRRSSI